MRSVVVLMALVGCAGGAGDGPQDLDGDGFTDDVDCNDRNTNVNPDGREVCDGFDNDCDGMIDDADPDVDSTGFAIYFEDGDGDGYGNPKSTLEACSPPAGYVANDADCDDERVLVSPEQNEKCDGLDNDCDPYTPDSGVAFQQTTGEWTNLTGQFRDGDSDSPTPITLAQEGTLFVCEGNYYVSLNVQANVELRGLYGSDRTVIDGGDLRPAVWIDSPVDVEISGLSLTGGFDSNNDGFGASLHCGRRANVSGEGLIIEGGGEAEFGGAVSAIGECSLSLTNTEIRFATADHGGLMYVSESTVTLNQVGFLEGQGDVKGGALAIGSVHVGPSAALPSRVVCTGCSFQSNRSLGVDKRDGGGAAFVGAYGSLEATDTLFIDNGAASIGGAILIDTDSFGGASVDLTSAVFADNDDNAAKTPNDIDIPAAALRYDYSKKDKITVTCTELSGCK